MGARGWPAALAAATLLACTWCPTLAQDLTQRSLTVTAAQFSPDARWFEPSKVNPLDDVIYNPLSAPPELAVWCSSPWYPASQWSQFEHLTRVDLPGVWFYPLQYDLGVWPYLLGDNMTCELWECDGGPGGCDRATQARPSAAAGDDYIGRGSFSFVDFKNQYSVQVPFSSDRGGRNVSAIVQFECSSCTDAWAKSPNWKTPYSPGQALPPGLMGYENLEGQLGALMGAPAPALPLARAPSPAPALDAAQAQLQVVPTPGPVATPVVGPVVAAQQGPGSQPMPATEPTPASTPTLAPTPTLTPTSVDQQAVPAAQHTANAAQQPAPEPATPAPPAAEEASSTANTVLVAVLASLGGIVAALLAGLAACFLRRRCCFRKRIQPDPVWPEDQLATKNPTFVAEDEEAARGLQVRVQKPKEADRAMRAHAVPAANVLIPGWEPGQAPRPAGHM